MGDGFWCKDCKYVWKSKKDRGRPAICPRCGSKKIVFDLLKNGAPYWMFGSIGIIAFVYSFFVEGSLSEINTLRVLGLAIAIPTLLGLLVMYLIEHPKNKRIVMESKNWKK